MTRIQPFLGRIKELEEAVQVKEVVEYRKETVDDSNICNETLEIIRSLPNFDGTENYVSWREAAHGSIVTLTLL